MSLSIIFISLMIKLLAQTLIERKRGWLAKDLVKKTKKQALKLL